jgi:hypothetical protein
MGYEAHAMAVDTDPGSMHERPGCCMRGRLIGASVPKNGKGPFL